MGFKKPGRYPGTAKKVKEAEFFPAQPAFNPIQGLADKTEETSFIPNIGNKLPGKVIFVFRRCHQTSGIPAGMWFGYPGRTYCRIIFIIRISKFQFCHCYCIFFRFVVDFSIQMR
jgi:hypothetical protein